MKTMELERFSVSELSKEESIEITGGSFWSQIVRALTFVGMVILMELAIDELNALE